MKLTLKWETQNTISLEMPMNTLYPSLHQVLEKKPENFILLSKYQRYLAKIVTLGKKNLKNVYDPTCGSGSLLLRVSKEAKIGDFYGQELNQSTYNLARMNMILHDVKFEDFDIQQGDSIENPYTFWNEI